LTIGGGGNIAVSGGGTLTGLPATPIGSTDAASKAYVDGLVSGIAWKPSVLYATAAALPSNTYSNGALGVGATLTATAVGVLTVDGVAPALGDRILVKNEATPANNGIYTLTTAGTVGVPYVLTRATDADISAELQSAATFVTNGTVNLGTAFTQSTLTPTVGTSDLTWVQIGYTGPSLTGSYTAVDLPDADNAAFTPVRGVYYFNDLWTAAHELRFTAASLAPLGMSPGDVYEMVTSAYNGFAISIRPIAGVTEFGVTGFANNWPYNNFKGIRNSILFRCTGVGTYTLYMSNEL
jgi:hypothetical protein